jgi:hypothetical protein
VFYTNTCSPVKHFLAAGDEILCEHRRRRAALEPTRLDRDGVRALGDDARRSHGVPPGSRSRRIINRMGVAYSSPDSALTRITVLYRCPCGAAVSEVGVHAGELPPGWERFDDERCACAHCAELIRAGKLSAPGPA